MKIEHLKHSLRPTLTTEFFETYKYDEERRLERYTEELAENETKKKLTIAQVETSGKG